VTIDDRSIGKYRPVAVVCRDDHKAECRCR